MHHAMSSPAVPRPNGLSKFIAGVICALAFCGVAISQQGSLPARNADEDEIFEAVIRNQMESWIENGDKNEKDAKDKNEKEIAELLNFKVFFVSVKNADPSDEFMKRFQDIPRTVKKVSSAEIGKAWRLPVLDKMTGQRGIIFNADTIHWRSGDSVEVEGGYHCDGLCGVGIVFKLRREHGKWVIKSTTILWVS